MNRGVTVSRSPDGGGGGGGGDRAVEGCDATGAGEEGGEVEAGAVEPVAGATGTAAADVKAE